MQVKQLVAVFEQVAQLMLQSKHELFVKYFPAGQEVISVWHIPFIIMNPVLQVKQVFASLAQVLQ